MKVETGAHITKTTSTNPPKKSWIRCCLYFSKENLYSLSRSGYSKKERSLQENVFRVLFQISSTAPQKWGVTWTKKRSRWGGGVQGDDTYYNTYYILIVVCGEEGHGRGHTDYGRCYYPTPLIARGKYLQVIRRAQNRPGRAGWRYRVTHSTDSTTQRFFWTKSWEKVRLK